MHPKRGECTPIMHQKWGVNCVKWQKISDVRILGLLHCLVRGVKGVRGVKMKGAVLYVVINIGTVLLLVLLQNVDECFLCSNHILLRADHLVFGSQ